jgi:hypothetical protein
MFLKEDPTEAIVLRGSTTPDEGVPAAFRRNDERLAEPPRLVA